MTNDRETVAYVAGLVASKHEAKRSACDPDDDETKEDEKESKTRVSVDPPSAIRKDTKRGAFASAFDRIASGILSNLRSKYELGDEATKWVKDMMYYTVPGGKMNRGMSVIDTLRAMKGAETSLTNAELDDATTLGWCIEFLQAFFLVADDVMDRSQTRRGRPCWYLKPNVKEIAINDSFLLQSFVFDVIKRHFGDDASRTSTLINLFLEVTLQTEVGQLYDLTSQPIDGEPDLDRFTLRRYRQIVKYKTAFYSFYLPVACGMILGNKSNRHDFDVAREICVAMGEYFQIQDDYLDCFGDPAIIGKIGTDIQDNKCSWLVVQALSVANETQRKLLIECYGKDNDDAVRKVKDLYRTLKIEDLFREYERNSTRSVARLMDKTKDIPRAVFENFLKKIYKRSK